MVDEEWLRKIAAKASPLADRLDGRFTPLAGQVSEKDIEKRLERWQERVAKGEKEKWNARLALDGLDEQQARKAVRSQQLDESKPLPDWTETLAEVIQVAESVPTSGLQQPMPATPEEEPSDAKEAQARQQIPVRFAEFALPFLEVARRRLRRLAGDDALDLLGDNAREALEADLLGRLSGICWQTLYWEFSIFRSARRSSIFCRFTQEAQQPTTDLYARFTERHLSDGLAGLLEQYPILARLMATCTRLWAEAVVEFAGRLRADLPQLRSLFSPEGRGVLGQVTGLAAGLSDPHNGGRTAATVTFESGLKLVYKPRDLGLERAWFGFLDWLNRRGAPLQLKVIEVLDRGTHGWVEFVTHEPVADLDAARRYYRRVGALLALLHVLEGRDFHQENIIAHGEHPVLVDLEMILHHRLPLRETEQMAGADLLAGELLSNSVVRSGLLPQWAIDSPGEAVDMSGLGSTEGNLMPEVPRLEHVNTDSVDVVYKRAEPGVNTNELLLRGQPQAAADYVDEIIDGFERIYCHLIQNREEIVAADGPLVQMKAQRVRFIYRPTRLYGQLLNYTLQPRFLRDGADRSIELEMLSRRFVLSDDKQERLLWPMLCREIESLEQLDVPIFHARSDADCLPLDENETIDHCFREASDALVVTRFQQLSEEDRRQQSRAIRGSLYSRAARHAGRAVQTAVRNLDDVEPLSTDEALAEAVVIGEELCERAIVADDGSVTWLGLEFIPGPERWKLQPLDRELYGGACGVALFLATLHHASGDGRFRDLGMASLVSLQKTLRDPDVDKRLDERVAIGGAVGLASYAYALSRVGELLGEDELLADAHRAAALLQPDRIEKDERLDVIAGAAGAILGLLAWRRRGGDGDVLNTAIACGEHLLEKRTETKQGPRAWRAFGDSGQFLTGFSHGAGGNAYALLRLFEATGEQRYKEAAEEAIRYERALFSPEQANWPDLREAGDDSEPGFMVAWCHGAPGIGLARLGGLRVLDSPRVREEIDVAMQTTADCPLGGRDNLCCGTMGRTDILLSFARRLKRPQVEDRARRHAAWTVCRARQQGYRILDIEAQDAFVPGMFQGLSGIGYAMLRLADPKLPSVLLWE